MRKRLSLVLLLALFASCYVSVHRAWLPTDVVSYPRLAGAWYVHQYGDAKGDEIPDVAWHLAPRSAEGVAGFLLDIVDENGRTARLRGVFFRLGQTTYVETTAVRIPANELALMHTISGRVVSRVDIKKGQLRLFAIDPDRLGGMPAGGFNALPTSEWRALLAKKGSSIFFARPYLLLRRTPR